MDPSVATFYRDHDNLRKILNLLEQALIDICRGYVKDYHTLQHLIIYIQDYPDRIHHPAEDVMFSVLLEHDIDDVMFSENIKKLVKDHSELDMVTRSASEAVELAVADTPHDVTDMTNKISLLLSRKRAHILYEEMNVYPYVNRYLNDADWERIVALVPDEEDPVFGSIPRKEFEQIFNAIMARGYC